MINWEMIGVVIGAIAIEISIVYLALQIRQDGRVVRFKAHQTRSESLSSAIKALYSDPELKRLWQLNEGNPVLMKPERREPLSLTLYSIFRNFYNACLTPEIDQDLSRQFVRLLDRFLARKGAQGRRDRQGKNFLLSFSLSKIKGSTA